MTQISWLSVQKSFKNFSRVSNIKLKRRIGSKLCFWQMDKAKVTCSDGQESFLELFLELFFSFRSFCVSVNTFHCVREVWDPLFSRVPLKADLSFPQMAIIISDSPKVNPFFQKGTRSWCKYRLEPILPLGSLQWLNYEGPCFPRTVPKHWEACVFPSCELGGWQQSRTNRRHTREQHRNRKQGAQYRWPARKAVSGARARGHCPGNSRSVRKLGAQRAPWATWFAHWPRGGRSLSSLGCAFGCHEMSNVEI